MPGLIVTCCGTFSSRPWRPALSEGRVRGLILAVEGRKAAVVMYCMRE